MIKMETKILTIIMRISKVIIIIIIIIIIIMIKT